MKVEDYDLLLSKGMHRFFTFRRAGLEDLALLMQALSEMGATAQKWRGQYQVPTMVDGAIGTPLILLSQLRGSTNMGSTSRPGPAAPGRTDGFRGPPGT
jgi:hypothetical protein